MVPENRTDARWLSAKDLWKWVDVSCVVPRSAGEEFDLTLQEAA